jgi:hypothetical protein
MLAKVLGGAKFFMVGKIILPPKLDRLLLTRSTYSSSKLESFGAQLSGAKHIESFHRLAIYAAGSYGRLEASKHSDIDLFFVVAKNRDSLTEVRVPEIRLLSEIIDIGFRMRFPKFSNDGEYLKILYAEDMLKNLGSPDDDYNNHFTARMLLLLEGRAVYGHSIFRSLLKNTIATYFRDYPHHSDDFRPTFLINDILRFWKTLCLNYEHKRNQEDSRYKIKHKIKNFKLGFSRLLTCFATVAALSTFRQTVTPANVLRICRMTPTKRLIFAAAGANSEAQLKVQEALELYGWFLEKTALRTAELEKFFSIKANRAIAFSKSRQFGDKIFNILQELDDQNRSVRYLVV